MKKFITYRLAGVGVWHYEFCLDGDRAVGFEEANRIVAFVKKL